MPPRARQDPRSPCPRLTRGPGLPTYQDRTVADLVSRRVLRLVGIILLRSYDTTRQSRVDRARKLNGLRSLEAG